MAGRRGSSQWDGQLAKIVNETEKQGRREYLILYERCTAYFKQSVLQLPEAEAAYNAAVHELFKIAQREGKVIR